MNFKSLFSLCLLYFIQNLCTSQNLIPNPGFEKYAYNINMIRNIESACGWERVTNTTPDHYVGDSRVGYIEKAIYGNAYAAIYAYHGRNEMITAKLNHTLVKGKMYHFECEVIQDSDTKFDTVKFQIAFTTKKYRRSTKSEELLILKPQITNFRIPKEYEKFGWKKISSTFAAEGNEQYILIANFEANNPALSIGGTYYLIDQICLAEMDENGNYDCSLDSIQKLSGCCCDSVPQFVIDKPIVLTNIEFENNKAILKSSSYKELNSLVDYLLNFLIPHVTISGHTDSVGTQQYNQKLSEDRAKAVADYLISQGIKPERITAKGFGSSMPIASNFTPHGRAKNRRVEFLITRSKKNTLGK